MSNAEVMLGATMYVDMVNADLRDAVEANKHDYVELTTATRDMKRWLSRHDCISRDENGAWQVNDDIINALDDKTATSFVPHYQKAVKAHDSAKGPLVRDGKTDYLEKFRDLHADTIFEMEPEKMIRVRPDDMKQIAGSALGLMEAMDADPAQAAFVSGLNREALDSTRDLMAEMGYIVPGEDTTLSSLADQSLRGTPEQQEALYYQATAAVANLEPPDTLKPGDRPMAAAVGLRGALDSAHVDEVPTRMPTMDMGGSLTPQDATVMTNLFVAYHRCFAAPDSAKWTTDNLDALEVDTDRAAELGEQITAFREQGLSECLSSNAFDDQRISRKEAREITQAVDFLAEALTTNPDDVQYTGGEGGMLKGEGAYEAEAEGAFPLDASNPFDAAIDGDDSGREAADGLDSWTPGGSAQEAAADALLGETPGKRTRVSLGLVNGADRIMTNQFMNGNVSHIAEMAGMPDVVIEDIEQAAFGTTEETMGEERMHQPVEDVRPGHVVTPMEMATWAPEKRAAFEERRHLTVKPGRAPLDTYKSGAESVGDKKMTTYLRNNMVVTDDDGTERPNWKLRSWLRDATEMRVKADVRSEGEAVVSFAQAWVERERQEQAMRTEAAREKRGITRVEVDTRDVARMLDVADSVESRDPARVELSAEGKATMTHPTGLRLRGGMDQVPEEISKSGETGPRRFGGQIDLDMLRAARETGAEKVEILMDGERPYGAIGKMKDAPARAAERKAQGKGRRSQEQIVLS